MEVLEAARTMNLPDPRVWVVGDWHGNVGWVQRLLPALGRIDRQIETLLHVGDFWTSTRTIDYWAKRTGIKRVLVTLGNHEPYGAYMPLLDAHPGCAVRVSEVVWLLPRPWQFEIMGRSVVSLGGAASIDRDWRTPGVDWWPEEEITDGQVEAALAWDAQVLLTHESPEETPILQVRAVIDRGPDFLPGDVATRARRSRGQVQRVWDGLRPELLVHGHFHITGYGETRDGRRVVSLGCDGDVRNVAVLDLATLDAELIEAP